MSVNIQQNIDVVQGITRKDFEENYYYPQKPVVIKGLVDGYPASEKWNFQFFKDEMGDMEVGVFDGALEKADRSFKHPDYFMKFRDYLNEIEAGPTKKRLFLFNPFKVNKRLFEDFEFPKICSGFLRSFPFMFFGGDGSVTRIHQDMDMSCVFLTQFTGKKRVVLFDPKYSSLLYRLPYNVHTAINIDKPDFQKFPGLKYVTGQEALLDYGDTIFIPAGWWHHIEYVGSGFSMSLRCLSPRVKDLVQGGWNVTVNTHLDEIMLKMRGKKWFNYKERVAIKNAKRAISRIEGNMASQTA